MKIYPPPHQVEQLWEILNSIPPHQMRTSVKKWHTVLKKMRSVSLTLPGPRHMSSHLQNAFALKLGACVDLNKGVHQTLDDSQWLAKDITYQPTRIAKIVPLSPLAEGHHDESSIGVDGVWFPGMSLVPIRGHHTNVTVLLRYKWPQKIVS